MKVVKGLMYSKDHEWVKVEGNTAYVGITDYARQALGDIVFVELPRPGAKLAAGDAVGAVESVKAASDVYTPVSGTVAKVNETLADSPEKISEDPYENWIAALELDDAKELEKLMDDEEYEKFCEKGD